MRGAPSRVVAYKTTDLGLPQPAAQPRASLSLGRGGGGSGGTEISAPVLGATTNPTLAHQAGVSLSARPPLPATAPSPSISTGGNASPTTEGRAGLTTSLTRPTANHQDSGGGPAVGSNEWARERVRSMDLSHHQFGNNNNSNNFDSIHKRPQSVEFHNLMQQQQGNNNNSSSRSPPPTDKLPPIPPSSNNTPPASFSPSGFTSVSPSNSTPFAPSALSNSRNSVPSRLASSQVGSYVTIRERNLRLLNNNEYNSDATDTTNNNGHSSAPPSKPPPPIPPYTKPPPIPPAGASKPAQPPTPQQQGYNVNSEGQVGALNIGKFEKNIGASLKKNKKLTKAFLASADKKRPPPNPLAK